VIAKRATVIRAGFISGRITWKKAWK